MMHAAIADCTWHDSLNATKSEHEGSSCFVNLHMTDLRPALHETLHTTDDKDEGRRAGQLGLQQETASGREHEGRRA